MVEPPAGAIVRGPVQPAGEVQERGDDVLRDGAGFPVAARRGDDHVAAPEIAPTQIARPRWPLVEPAQSRRPRSEVEGEGKAAQDHLGLGQHGISRFARACAVRIGLEVAIDGKSWPSGADLAVEPAPCVGQVDAGIDPFDPRTVGIIQADDRENLHSLHCHQSQGKISGQRTVRRILRRCAANHTRRIYVNPFPAPSCCQHR